MRIFSKILANWRNSLAAKFAFGDVLDVGCNDGSLINFLDSNKVRSYTGVDIQDTEQFVMEKAKIKKLKCAFYKGNILELTFENKFDAIFLIALLEHFRHPEKLVAHVEKYLKSDGVIVVTTPSPVGEKLHSILANLNVLSKEAVLDHVVFLDKTKLEEIFAKHNFTIVIYKPFQFGFNQLLVTKKIAKKI